MASGGWVKSHLHTRIDRLVPSMKRLTHLSLVSSSQFDKYLLSSPENLSSQVARRSLAGPSQVARGPLEGVPLGGSPFFQANRAHSEKVCSSLVKRGAARAAQLITQGIMNMLERHSMFLHVLACSCMFLHVLACSCIFMHFHSFSFNFCQFLSISVIVFSLSFFFFFLLVLFFSGAQNLFLPRLPHDFI